MKKVPFLGDVEKSIDDSLKDAMGSWKSFYPALKMALICSNPTSLTYYLAYRSIPYFISALTCNKAINMYKSAGKSIGSNFLKFGAIAAVTGGKYTLKALGKVARFGQKQFNNITDYFMQKDKSVDNIKDNFNDIEINTDLEQNYIISPSINSDLNINQENEITMNNPNNLVQEDVASYLNDVQASANRDITNEEIVVLSDGMSLNNEISELNNQSIDLNNEDISSNNQNNTLTRTFSMGGSDEVIFNISGDRITKQYRLCGVLGGSHEITQEEYESYINSVEISERAIENQAEQEIKLNNENELSY